VQDQLAELFYYLKGALKYRGVAIALAWIVCLSGWIVVSALPNKYTSEAKVHVDTGTMLVPLLKGMTVQSDVRGLLRVMQLLMFTQHNLEQIIELANLNKNIKSASDKLAIMDNLKKDIHISGEGNDIFTINYEAGNPNDAKRVVQAVLTVFSEQTQRSTLAGVDVAHRFIDEQIQEYENRLRNAEKARENFKRTRLGLLPGDNGGQIAQAQSIVRLLDEARMQLNESQSRRDILAAQFNEIKDSNEDWTVTTDAPKEISEEDSRIASLKNRKKELLIKYTDSHPEILSLNKTIAELENQKNSAKMDEQGNLQDYINPSLLANPYVQTIKVALNEAEAELAAKRSRVSELQQRVDKINQELDARLSVETELQNLNRDYDAIKTNYEKLLESREQASMSQKVDDQAEALKFKIADAPNVPLEPSSPKRKLLYTGVLLLGCILGIGIAFLLYLIRPTILTVSQLREVTQLPVLGSVSNKKTVSVMQQHQKELMKSTVFISALILVYFGFMLTEIMHIKLYTVLDLTKYMS
jgi:polysaccharide chain length determinant protein (PEP-CTERM system associated)